MKTMKMMKVGLAVAIVTLLNVGCAGLTAPVSISRGTSVPVRFGHAQLIIQDYQHPIYENIAEKEFPEFNYRYKQAQLSPFFNLPLLNKANNSKNNLGSRIILKHSLNQDASYTIAETEHFRFVIMPGRFSN